MTSRTIRALVVLLSVFALTSCFEVDTTIRVDDEGNAAVRWAYRFPQDVYDLAIYDDVATRRAVPIHESDFRRMENVFPGFSVLSYRLERDDGDVRVTVEAEVAADVPLGEVISGFGDAIDLQVSEAGGMFRMVIARAAREGDGDAPPPLLPAMDGAVVSFVFEAPHSIASTNLGTIDGRRVTVSYPFVDLIELDQDLVWNIDW